MSEESAGTSPLKGYGKYLLIPVFVLVVGYVLLYLTYKDVKQEIVEDLNARQMIHARQAARGIEAFFEDQVEILQNLARNEHIVLLDEKGKGMMREFQSSHSEEISIISREDSQGRILYAEPYDPTVIGQPVTKMEDFEEAKRTQKVVVSDVFTNRRGFKSIIVHVPILEQDNFEGTLAMLLPFDVIAKRYIADIKIGKDGYAWVISRNGTEISCPVPGHVGNSVFDNCREFSDILSMAERMTRGEEGTTTYTFDRLREDVISKTTKHAVFMPIHLGNNFWSIVVATPEDQVISSLQGFRNRLLLIAMLLIIGMGVFFYLMFRARLVVQELEQRKKTEAEVNVGLRMEIEQRKLAEDSLTRERNQAQTLLNLYQLPESSVQDFSGFLVAECIKISESQLGFFGFISEDETLMAAHLWSEKAMENCAIDNRPVEFSLGDAGIWAEAIREHRPIIVNDYQKPDSRKKGYPGGHVPISNLLSVPIVEAGRAVAIIAVANKRQDYSESDTFHLNLLIQSVWGIMQRKKAEVALLSQNEMQQTILDSIPVMLAIFDREGQYQMINRSWQSTLGWSLEEMQQHKDVFAEFYPDPEYRKYVLDFIKTAAGTESWIDFKTRKRDGQVLDTSWVNVPLSDGSIIGIGIDITERKRAEDERLRLEDRLQRAEKMEALGTLAGGVAHDLNNVLGVVVGYSEMLLDDFGDPSSVKSDATEILKAGQRAAGIVQDLLTLTRRGVQSRKILNLNRIIMDCKKTPEFVNLLSYHSNIEIKTDLEPNLLNLSGSSIHLGKSFMNLISNAAEAMPNGGTLTVRSSNIYLEKPILGYDEVREGDYVVLSISDTGEGIPASDLKRIFEPFYTKKVMGRSGTGLGLAVVWGTVKDHLGYVNVESVEGKGTTFTLYFPVTREEISAEQVSVPVAEYMGKGEIILVVDDVKEQREIAERMLAKLKYMVTTVSSGEDAVEYLKQNAVDLVVLDMIMDPGMDGLDTYRKILEVHPHQKAIIVSGFSETERVSTAKALGAGAYVKKPYVLEKLGLAVRKELDQTA